ncbi:hypothetical protein DAMA08_006920 [Martiniozyma asiatica (nom. inval.)]|nr:hypothetical protein DAMA08_006920 [Martiniozyma asiatica]
MKTCILNLSDSEEDNEKDLNFLKGGNKSQLFKKKLSKFKNSSTKPKEIQNLDNSNNEDNSNSDNINDFELSKLKIINKPGKVKFNRRRKIQINPIEKESAKHTPQNPSGTQNNSEIHQLDDIPNMKPMDELSNDVEGFFLDPNDSDEVDIQIENENESNDGEDELSPRIVPRFSQPTNIQAQFERLEMKKINRQILEEEMITGGDESIKKQKGAIDDDYDELNVDTKHITNDGKLAITSREKQRQEDSKKREIEQALDDLNKDNDYSDIEETGSDKVHFSNGQDVQVFPFENTELIATKTPDYNTASQSFGNKMQLLNELKEHRQIKLTHLKLEKEKITQSKEELMLKLKDAAIHASALTKPTEQ